MSRIVEAFEAGSGHTVQQSVGSSGKLYAQISHGAPFDVLFSADQRVPLQLEADGAAVADSRFTYAVGQLVLWSAEAGLVDDEGQVLMGQRFSHLAIANPRLAPYGAAAVEILAALGRYDALRKTLVTGENIAQTYHFVSTGHAMLGFVAASQVMTDGKLRSGSGWLVPRHLYSPIRQDAVLLKTGAGNAAARALLEFVRSPQAQNILRSHGYLSASEELQ